jgi:hypothetical protein
MDHLLASMTGVFEAMPAWLSAVTSVIAAASAVAALTPTPRDDKLLGKLHAVVNLLALNIGYAKREAQKRK